MPLSRSTSSSAVWLYPWTWISRVAASRIASRVDRPSRTLTPLSVVLVVICTDQLVQRVASVTLCVKIFLELFLELAIIPGTYRVVSQPQPAVEGSQRWTSQALRAQGSGARELGWLRRLRSSLENPAPAI